jgi:hypothetical protein
MYLQTVELLQTEVCKTGNSQVTMVVAIVQCSNYLDDFGYLHDLGNLIGTVAFQFSACGG